MVSQSLKHHAIASNSIFQTWALVGNADIIPTRVPCDGDGSVKFKYLRGLSNALNLELVTAEAGMV
uniref:Uncharacterized protein n=1 Tax=Leersia perrieri TaxID=77586 RepID=A0A0D9XQ54_9ORYZ